MRIGIDISQIAYEGTGVARYLQNLVKNLLEADDKNEYILFFSSMRGSIQNSKFKSQNHKSKVKIKRFKFPPTLLDLLWNKLHIVPIEWFIGNIDVFITSDWTDPPVMKAKKATILYDLIAYKYPLETDQKIIDVQKRKFAWARKETDMFFCISEATKKDAMEVLGISDSKLAVIYPGL